KPKYKEVILLHYYQQLKVNEIAAVLGAPQSTVSIRLRRAREALKKRLEGGPNEDL
ncbi:MAG TPA: RNA polymerase subunit sigma-24, partial [Candidatus Fournierella merdipullorum]|nr:RNA polymerase subunit sigma-24 [Candidatus Fournierella merdipullorum]